jgi:hypothetical protein
LKCELGFGDPLGVSASVGKGSGEKSRKQSTVVRSGKIAAPRVTTETANRLERAGSFESAKIARELAKGA